MLSDFEKEILYTKNLNVFSSTAQGIRSTILESVSFVVSRDDIIGVVGETGAGKSVLINALGCNTVPPLSIEAEQLSLNYDGRVEDLLLMDEDELRNVWGTKIAFIPSNTRDRLNPYLKVGNQATKVVQTKLKLNTRDAREKVLEMFRMVQMPDPERNYENYPHELSGGMAQRVVISISLALSPSLLMADEPTMGLDVTIQTQVLDLMVSLLKKHHSGVMLATRDLGIVANYCNRVVVLCDGQLVESASVRDFFKKSRHPYSQYLLAAAFASCGKEIDVEYAMAQNRANKDIGSGCKFANRCRYAKDICWSTVPNESAVEKNHLVRCHNLEDSSFERNT